MGRPRKNPELTPTEEGNLANLDLPTITTDVNPSDIEMQLTKLETTVTSDVIPGFCEPEWHDYVMKHFEPDELFKGNPTTDGMRRVVELLIGRIVRGEARSIQWPGVMDDGRLSPATVEYRLEIVPKHEVVVGVGLQTLHFVEVADASHINTVGDYAMHPSAMAATRAEGRALRKALKLRRIVSAEEAMAPKLEESELNGKIRKDQINFINIFASKNNIDVMKYVNSGSKQYGKITDVPYDKAVEMVAYLSKLHTNHESVPENIKGYDVEWAKKDSVTF